MGGEAQVTESKRGENTLTFCFQKFTSHWIECQHKSKKTQLEFSRSLCHSPLTAFCTDCPGSAEPLEWAGTSGIVSRIDCETREDEHKTAYHKYSLPYVSTWFMFCCIFEFFSQKAILDSMKGLHLISFVFSLSSDLYSSHSFLKRELSQGQNNHIFLNVCCHTVPNVKITMLDVT